jgi:hypothetical protein
MSADQNDFRLLQFTYNEEKRKCVCLLLSEMVGEMRSLHCTKERYGESEEMAEWGQLQA